ncbi:MAG: serine--tRNA ligase, partial [Bacteroidota bacterium]|nr:serine--tRNA ligase [Bacteroidota bacterium]
MLQISFLRENKELVKERLAIKNFKESDLVDSIILMDDERKRLQSQFDETQSKINSSSKEIGQLMAKNNKDAVEKIKHEVATLKSSLQPINNALSETEKKLQDELIKLPNLPHSSVPAGKTPEENIIVREG